MAKVFQSFSLDSFMGTMQAGANRANEGIPVGVGADSVNKTNATGRSIDNFLRGMFDGMPGILPLATTNRGPDSVSTEPLADVPGARTTPRRQGTMDDPRIAEERRKSAGKRKEGSRARGTNTTFLQESGPQRFG